MMSNFTSNYTSLELSKKLAKGGCKLESKQQYHPFSTYLQEPEDPTHYLHVIPHDELRGYVTEKVRSPTAYDILNDICCKYAPEFFGVETTIVSGWTERASEWTFSTPPSGFVMKDKSCVYHPQVILRYMQQGKKQEAEDYIWEHCLFNKEANHGE